MLTLFIFAALALSDPTGYPPDADCQSYKYGSTMDMAECLTAQSELWDKRLNKEYLAVIKRAEVDVEKLRRAQRIWIRFRDANCATYVSVEGSISTILTGTCWRDMTRSRTLELHEMAWKG